MKAKQEMELLRPVRGNPLLTELVDELAEAERIWGEHFVVLFDPSELAIVGLPKEGFPSSGKAYKPSHQSRCMQPVKCDSKGRLVLRHAIRERYGERYYIVPAPGNVLLVPVPKDPVADLRREGRKLPDVPIAELREIIDRQAKRVVLRRTRTRTSSSR